MRPPLVYDVFGCLLSSALRRTYRYAVCLIWPSCAMMREDPRMFFAHTLRHLVVEDEHFLFLGPPEWIFFRAYVNADFVTSTPLCGLPMWTPWLLVRRDLSKNVCEKKKRALFNHLCRINDFFVVKACTPVHMRVRQSKNCEFENKRRLLSDQFGHGESESGP
jgi:hypothetical protein